MTSVALRGRSKIGVWGMGYGDGDGDDCRKDKGKTKSKHEGVVCVSFQERERTLEGSISMSATPSSMSLARYIQGILHTAYSIREIFIGPNAPQFVDSPLYAYHTQPC